MFPLSRFPDDDWHALTKTLESFSEAWDSSPVPPLLSDFLRESGNPLRNRTAAELVKLDLECRWQRGLRLVLEDYADEVPDFAAVLTADLVLEEFQIRRAVNDPVSPAELHQRFPALADDLESLLRINPAFWPAASPDTATRPCIPLTAGDAIDDFDLLLELGRGAFATVFLARQKSMQRLVALKASADQSQEPQTLAQLDHENIIRVYDQRLLPERSLRLLYMQYAPGGTLSDVIRKMQSVAAGQRSGRIYLQAIDAVMDARGDIRPGESAVRRRLADLTWPQLVCWVGSQLARALDYAHRAGVLHRDIKPANVLLSAEGIPKLADFHISFGANLAGSRAEAGLGGSLAYMSPEQLEACCSGRDRRRADALDGRSDLFSLGVMLCELLTGERPFLDDRERAAWSGLHEALIERRRQGPALEVRSRLHKADDCGLAEVAIRCLTPDPEGRCPTGIALANDLELCLQPEARKLLCDDSTRWKQLVRRWPLVSIVVTTLIPNIITAIFNLLYNRGEIIDKMPDAEPTFMRIQLIINLLAFPAGMLSSVWLIRAVTQVAGSQVAGTGERASPPGDVMSDLRGRCLKLGGVASLVGLILWMIAAPAYPILLQFLRGSVPMAIYGHFLASLTLCGLIAAAYPFFGVSLIAVRCLYPRLIQLDALTAADLTSLKRLARTTWLHLFLAAAVPMLAVLILAVADLNRPFALMVLAFGGTVGFAVAVCAFRLLQQDLQVLMKAVTRSLS